MKHIRSFKDIELKYSVGEPVVLTGFDPAYLTNYFKVGDVYKIYEVDKTDRNHPYAIIDNGNNSVSWVRSDQIRKAEDWELDQNKYNL